MCPSSSHSSHTPTVVTVAESSEPVTTQAGLRTVPDMLLGDLDPSPSDLLVIAGAPMWDAGGGVPFTSLAGRFLQAGVPVAAICGATAGLARAGLLDARDHIFHSADLSAFPVLMHAAQGA
jgi:putative intracellular protease/amidase